MKTTILTSLTLALVALPSHADTNVDESIEQLKTNVENAKSNYEQYEENAKIAGKNFKTTSEAIVVLKNQKQQVLKTDVNIDENQKVLDQVKLQLKGLKAEEQKKLDEEQKQAQKLEARLNEMKKNLEKRKLNLEAYDRKMAEVDKEKNDWEFQRKNMQNLVSQIQEKQKQAESEKVTWGKKKDSYEAEAKKWKNASSTAEKQLAHIEKIKN